MRCIYRLALLVVFAGLFPALAAPPVPESNAPDRETIYRNKLLAKGIIPGKLKALNVDGDEKTFTIEVPFQKFTPNADGQKRFAEVYQRFQNAYRSGNKGEAQKLYNEAADAYRGQWDVEDTPFEFQCKAGEDLKVRKATVPPKETADGKLVRYSAKEIAELKGDPKLPGYLASIKDLDQDQYVVVYIDKTKYKPVTKSAKDKDKEKEEAKPEEELVLPINIIMMVPAPAEMAGGNPFGGANPFKK